MDRVLIADDDVQLLTILTESLGKYSNTFEIVTAKNGLEAILALQKETFSAVITEIRMPKVNGLVLLGYLTKNFPDLPCIIITDSDSERLRRQLKKEAVQYIQKPFRIPGLADAILAVLDRKTRRVDFVMIGNNCQHFRQRHAGQAPSLRNFIHILRAFHQPFDTLHKRLAA